MLQANFTARAAVLVFNEVLKVMVIRVAVFTGNVQVPSTVDARVLGEKNQKECQAWLW